MYAVYPELADYVRGNPPLVTENLSFLPSITDVLRSQRRFGLPMHGLEILKAHYSSKRRGREDGFHFVKRSRHPFPGYPMMTCTYTIQYTRSTH